MTSVVSICNNALLILGEDSINALTDDNNRARALTTAYEQVRDDAIRAHSWNFAIIRVRLPALATVPEFGFSLEYQLPNDCLRVIQVSDFDVGPDMSDLRSAPTEVFSLEGRKIRTNLAAPLPIRYLGQIVDPSLFDANFADKLSGDLAERCCYRITNSTEKEAECRIAQARALRKAARANAFERASQYATDDTWVAARRQ